MVNPITEQAVRNQLSAMGSDTYIVGVYDRAGQSMHEETASAATILKTALHLESFNRNGREIYVRPDDPLRFTFVDDLKAPQIGEMKKLGFQPAVIVETSPANYQAWMKHPEALKEQRMGTLSAQWMARRFGGDPGGAAWKHNGRLAGFRNLKPDHYHDKKHPFVKLIEYSGRVFDRAPEFAERVAQKLDAQKQAEFRRAVETVNRGAERPVTSIEQYRSYPRFNGDLGPADLAWSRHALSRGLDRAAIAEAIATRDLSHKGDQRRQHDYIERTIDKAARSLGMGR